MKLNKVVDLWRRNWAHAASLPRSRATACIKKANILLSFSAEVSRNPESVALFEANRMLGLQLSCNNAKQSRRTDSHKLALVYPGAHQL